jgi:hypothetical protein
MRATLLLFLVAACGGGNLANTRQDLVAQTTAGKYRCESSSGDDKPFVVEWDATDSAAFEARASRGVLFVRYQGCDLKVLDRCEGSYPAELGTYNQPTFTSGSVQGFDIKNTGELYAQLPLGVASLSGKVEGGQELHLKYWVSGLVQATRDRHYKRALDKFPACHDATHFVSGYTLGAFELAASERSKVSGEAGFKGVGAGGSQAHQASSVAKGGNLASCETNTQTACRVPIRLILTRLEEGAPPAVEAGQPPPGTAPVAMPTPQVMLESMQRWMGAQQKLQARDGAGCLADIEAMDKVDPRPMEPMAGQREELRAHCEMAAGRCDDGKKRLFSLLVARDKERKQSDEQRNAVVTSSVGMYCARGSDAPQSLQLMIAQSYTLMQENDSGKCVARGNDIAAALARTPNADPMLKKQAGAILLMAASCAGKGGRCDDARKLFDAGVVHTGPGDFHAQVPACKK